MQPTVYRKRRDTIQDEIKQSQGRHKKLQGDISR